MTDFLRTVADDFRHGRENWRVIAVSSFISFVIAVAVNLAL